MITITIKDRIDELEKENHANPSTHKLSMGLDYYISFKEEMGLDADSSFHKYHGYEILVDTEDETGFIKFISKTF